MYTGECIILIYTVNLILQYITCTKNYIVLTNNRISDFSTTLSVLYTVSVFNQVAKAFTEI